VSDQVILIGYSGHAYVVADALESSDKKIIGYCENGEKKENLLNLKYFGSEKTPNALKLLQNHYSFIAIGNNAIREKVYRFFVENDISNFVNAIHFSSIISKNTKLKDLILVAPNATINAFSKIGTGVICNTGSIVEHECKIGDFAHIAPGATLAGNVSVGERSFIGANAVVKEGIKIGKDVIVGAGSVVINDIPDGQVFVGNPAQPIKNK
jgi:sugar O-acyltransferase (sialic acid O-acetyltransferase NeuD family)